MEGGETSEKTLREEGSVSKLPGMSSGETVDTTWPENARIDELNVCSYQK
jgi:hypothetical protein